MNILGLMLKAVKGTMEEQVSQVLDSFGLTGTVPEDEAPAEEAEPADPAQASGGKAEPVDPAQASAPGATVAAETPKAESEPVQSFEVVDAVFSERAIGLDAQEPSAEVERPIEAAGAEDGPAASTKEEASAVAEEAWSATLAETEQVPAGVPGAAAEGAPRTDAAAPEAGTQGSAGPAEETRGPTAEAQGPAADAPFAAAEDAGEVPDPGAALPEEASGESLEEEPSDPSGAETSGGPILRDPFLALQHESDARAVLELLERSGAALRGFEIAEAANIAPWWRLKDVLARLVQEGKVDQSEDGHYRLRAGTDD